MRLDQRNAVLKPSHKPMVGDVTSGISKNISTQIYHPPTSPSAPKAQQRPQTQGTVAEHQAQPTSSSSSRATRTPTPQIAHLGGGFGLATSGV